MKKILGIMIALVVLGVIFSGDDDAPGTKTASLQPSASVGHKSPEECDTSTEITRKKYNVLGSGINVRKGPGTSYDKTINQKATCYFQPGKVGTIEIQPGQ